MNSILCEDVVIKFLTDEIKYAAGEVVEGLCLSPFAVDGGFIGAET